MQEVITCNLHVYVSNLFYNHEKVYIYHSNSLLILTERQNVISDKNFDNVDRFFRT